MMKKSLIITIIVVMCLNWIVIVNATDDVVPLDDNVYNLVTSWLSNKSGAG